MAVGNPSSPMAVTMVDGATNVAAPSLSGVMAVAPAANYTAITTAGTTTVKSGSGVYFGATLWALGTAPTLGVLDGTSTLFPVGTGTAILQSLAGPPAGMGVRFNTSLVIVTAGTAAGSWNVLWD